MSRAATSRLKVNPALGSMPVLQYCTPAQLKIDDAYQRSLEASASQTLVRRIAMFWNWDLCQPLVVAKRDDGGLYVVDGQHRLAAAKLRGDIAQLPCVVTAYASAADEAASFVALNQQRRPLNALDLFKAALAAEDETAVSVSKLMYAAGLSLANHQNCISWKPGQVSNIGGILNCYNANGPDITLAALKILAAAFPGQILQYAGTIFGGLAYALSRDRTLDHAALTAVLSRTSQLGWRDAVAKHRAANTGDKFQVAAGKVIMEAMGRKLGAPVIAETQPKPATARAPQPEIPEIPVASGRKEWCNQCDKLVDIAAAKLCASKFCSLQRVAA